MPNGCGLGGDAFWLVWDEAAGEQVALNGSGRAPLATDADALRGRGLTRLPLRGPLSITVPGAVRSWGDAHRRWGRLSWEAVLAPAIEQAEGGFPAWDGLIAAVEGLVAEVGSESWGRGLERRGARRGGRGGPASGSACRARPHAADPRGPGVRRLLRRRARGADRPRPQRRGGAVHARATCASTARPGAARSRPRTAASASPPTRHSSGLIALEILNVLERFAPTSGARFGGRGWTDPAWIHLQLEAAKLAFADRDAHLTDPEAHDIPVDRLRSKEHAAGLAARIDAHRADPSPPPARTLVGGTIYLAVVDGDGNAVSLIQSNAAGFGSGVLDVATGVHFQDRGASFSLDPGHANVIAPGKRTAHTLLPGMLFREGDRRPWVVAGSMGGDIQPQIHVQLVSALVDGGADIRTAVAAPRVVVEPAGWFAPPVAIVADGALAEGVEVGLRALGHDLARTGFDGGLGHEHAIELVDGGPAADGTLAAIADPRSMGLAAVR